MPPKKDGKQALGKQLSMQDSQKRPSDMKRFSIHDTSGAAFDEQGDTKWGFDSEVSAGGRLVGWVFVGELCARRFLWFC